MISEHSKQAPDKLAPTSQSTAVTPQEAALSVHMEKKALQ